MLLRTFIFLAVIFAANGNEISTTESSKTTTESVSVSNIVTAKQSTDVTKTYKTTTDDATTPTSNTSNPPTMAVTTEQTTQSQGTTVPSTAENAVNDNESTSPANGTESSATTVNSETTTETAFIDVMGQFDEAEVSTASSTTTAGTTTEAPVGALTNKTVRMEKLSDQIRAVISHYKKHGTVTVPDASVPDPMPLPNMKKSFSGFDVNFSNQKVYGLSNYTIEHVNTDLDKMQVYVAVYMNKLLILGNYSAKTWFKKVAGPFNVTLQYVEASGAAALVRDAQGNLQASDSEMDMTFMDSRVNFGNMGVMGSLLQGVMATAGPVLFEAVKPVILKEINERVREDINKKIKTIGTRFTETGTTPPLELAIQEARKYVKDNGYDPYQIENYGIKYATNSSIFQVNLTNLVLSGLSDFRRVGEVSLSMDSGTIQIGLHLATSKLKGRCKWSIIIGKSFKKVGNTNFTVDYVQGRGIINQSLNVSQHPTLEDIDINVGKVRVQMKGTGPFDILVEAFVNTLPDLIRHVVVDAIELPLKFAVQHMLSEVNVEDVLNKQLPELDKIGL